MADILTSLESFFLDYSNSNLVVAYSGGVDSQVLLHALAQLKKQQRLNQNIHICHVNHGLSDNANAWQEFATQQCLQANFPLTICQVELELKPQQSLEAIARDARYQALQSVAHVNDLIVTGHHGDDQAETFLLALKRGSGIKGLSAMKTVMSFGQQFLVRPLLNHSRVEIEKYAQDNQLDWIEDESNLDITFDRNFLRHQVLPILNQRWSSINKTILRSARLCSEAQELVDELAKQDLENCQVARAKLCCVALQKLSTARFNNVIRYFLQQQQVLMPSSVQLKELRQQLEAQQGKAPVVQLADHCLRRYQDKLYLTRIFDDVTPWQVKVNFSAKEVDKSGVGIILPDNLGQLTFLLQDNALKKKQNYSWQASMQAPKEGQKVSVRFTHNNPKCLPQYRQQSRPLKKVLQELAIPTWQRKRLPFVYYGEELVAVVGHFVCKPYLDNDQAPLVQLYWKNEA